MAIARALASKPATILADEPTGNLDSKTSLDVLGLMKTVSQEFHQSIVMITHNEIALDTITLDALGIPHKIGQEVTLSYY